ASCVALCVCLCVMWLPNYGWPANRYGPAQCRAAQRSVVRVERALACALQAIPADRDVGVAQLVQIAPQAGVILLMPPVFPLAAVGDPMEPGSPVVLDEARANVGIGGWIAEQCGGVLQLERTLFVGVDAHGDLQWRVLLQCITRRETTIQGGSCSSSHEARAQ